MDRFLIKNPTVETVCKIEKCLIDIIKKNSSADRVIIKEISSTSSHSSRLTMISYEKLGINGSGAEFSTKEFPNDQIWFDYSSGFHKPDIFGNGSIHRIIGKIGFPHGQYSYVVGEGDKLNLLTFAVIDKIGYVYMRGKGKLIKNDGTEILLGYNK